MSDERGVSSVLGVVLIVGMTAAMVTSLMLVGTIMLDSSKSDAELTRMETSMAQMSSKASLAALGDAQEQAFDLGVLRDGSLEVRENTGSVTIEYVAGGDEPTEANLTEIYHSDAFGALVYRQGNKEVAYQGGGVWRRTGDGGGEMVSPPEYHYLRETLTFPIIRTTGAGHTQARGSGTLRHVSFDTPFPTDNITNPVQNKTVYVEIESAYHRGWYEFFASRTDGLLEHEPAEDRVRAELSALYEDSYEWAAVGTDEVNLDGNSDVPSLEEGAHYPSASDRIAGNWSCDVEGFDGEDGPYEGGRTYCADDHVTLNNNIEFDTSTGDIQVVFHGGVSMELKGNDELTVAGDNVTSFYINESFGALDGNFNAGGDAEQFNIYVHSDIDELDEQGNGDFHGIIYAPNTAIEFGGNMDFEGAVIAETFGAHGNPSVSYDPALADIEIDLDVNVDELRYLHITENVIAVDLE